MNHVITTPKWHSHVTVATIIKQDDRYLMVKEKTSQGIVYNQPAGHLENNETIVEAAIRETLEETGQVFQPQYLVGVYNCPHHSGLKSFIRFTFFGSIDFKVDAKPQDDDIISNHWLTYDEISHLHREGKLRGEQVKHSINDYLNGNHYPLSLIVDFNQSTHIC